MMREPRAEFLSLPAAVALNIPEQWFSASIMLGPFNAVLHVVVTTTQYNYFCCNSVTVILLLFMNCHVNV